LIAAPAQAASAQEAQSFVNQADQVVEHVERNPGLDQLLRRARGVLIIPADGQGGFIVGGKSRNPRAHALAGALDGARA
jgi:lipid-binding SYLF domain-containing protein